MACNVLAAEPNGIARALSAWPPVALLLVIDVLARAHLPVGRPRVVAAVGAGAVALVAAVASFKHMHSVALAYGETELVAWMFPLSVDGLAIVVSVALFATAGPASDPVEEPEAEPEPAPVSPIRPAPDPDPEPVAPAAQLTNAEAAAEARRLAADGLSQKEIAETIGKSLRTVQRYLKGAA